MPKPSKSAPGSGSNKLLYVVLMSHPCMIYKRGPSLHAWHIRRRPCDFCEEGIFDYRPPSCRSPFGHVQDLRHAYLLRQIVALRWEVYPASLDTD